MSIVDAMDDPHLFREWFKGKSWDGWRTVLKAAYALPMTKHERGFFERVAKRSPPKRRVKELWVVAGRRAGKDSVASLIAAHSAASFDRQEQLRRGERALVMCLACDRDQSKIVLGYTRSYFEQIPMLNSMVTKATGNGLELQNRVDIVVATNSFRAVRGRAILAPTFDEVAFWRDERSAKPDEETYRAVIPGMATLTDAMLVGISTPYRRNGLLYRKWKRYFGRDDDDVLVIQAPSIVLNPTLDQKLIDAALEEDAAAAAAEWLAQWRKDVEAFVSEEVVEAAIVGGRFELPPTSGVTYVGFVDPSGGSKDSMTLAIAHRDRQQRVVLDAIREVRPPFQPDTVTQDFASLLKTYKCRKVQGDRYGGEWPRERFKSHGVQYEVAEQPKSDIYRDLLPALNSGKCELLDVQRLSLQLCGLERRTRVGGKDLYDHAPGAYDDVANAAAGALVMALNASKQLIVSDETLRRAALLNRFRFRGTGQPRAFF
jgi:hypothetical protein